MVELANGNGFQVWRKNVFGRLRAMREESSDLAERIRAVEGALNQLHDQREALQAAIAASGEEENSLAVNGGDYTDVSKVRTRRARTQWDFEQLSATEAPLLEELTALRGRQRQEQVAMFRARGEALVQQIVERAQEAFRAIDEYTGLWDAAASEGLQLPHAVAALTRENIARLAAAFEPAAPPAPAFRHEVPLPNWNKIVVQPSLEAIRAGPPRNAQGELISTHGNAAFAPQIVSPPSVARALYDEQAGPGQRRVVILRAGYEPGDGRQCMIGDIIAVDAAVAEAVVRNNAGEFVKETA
jgi:hypothetical protein